MADYTSPEYALSYGAHDPLYDMLRRRLRDQVEGYMRGQTQYGLGRLEARGLGQSGAVERLFGDVAGRGETAIAGGSAQIAEQQARERFALLQDAIRREAAKPGLWDVLAPLGGTIGSLLGQYGISKLLKSNSLLSGTGLKSLESGAQTDYTDEGDLYG